MRVLLAIVVLAMVCAPMAMANGAKVTPPTEVPTPQPETGAGPVCPPAVTPSPVNASVITVPMSVPVLMHKNVLNQIPCNPNVTVLVPTSIDSAMAQKIQANNQLTLVMTPVMMPIVANQVVAGRMISGAGPCPVNVDQGALNQIMSSPNATLMPLVAPIPFDQNVLNMVSSGQAVMMQQSSFSKIYPAGQPGMLMPMTLGRPSMPVVTGRGPSVCTPCGKAEASSVLSGGTVMVAMVVDRQTLANMTSSNNLMMVVPMMVPVPVTCSAPAAGAAGSMAPGSSMGTTQTPTDMGTGSE